MIGVFDSGVGGLTLLGHIRALMPRADVCFLADRKNSPYGTKTKDEILSLVRSNILALRKRGADKILMACCTASTVYPYLAKEEKEVCIPIIAPTARKALEVTSSGRIGVIATERTVHSSAFFNAIHEINPSASVTEIATQELVALAESGECDGYASADARNTVIKIAKTIKKHEIDTLILGCTHFPLFQKTISEALGEVKTVSCSREGAIALSKEHVDDGNGKIEFIF